MLTLKKEKGKQKHRNEKISERAQQVGPKLLSFLVEK